MGARFQKHYMQWLNFIMIIEITNKMFIFFSPKEILLDTNTNNKYYQYVNLIKTRSLIAVRFMLFSSNITKFQNFFTEFYM